MEISTYRYGVKFPKRKDHSGRRRIIITILLIFLLVSSYAFLALTKALPALDVTTYNLTKGRGQKIELPWPPQGQAAIGSLTEGALIASTTNEKARPIASMAKVITALAVMQEKPLSLGEKGESYVLDSEDLGYYHKYVKAGGSVAPVYSGQKLSLYDALQALLLPSANNIADSLVRWVFGDMKRYRLYAKDMLADFGLKRTVAYDASGFSPKTVSTPSEMLVIAQRVMRQPVIAQIVAKKSATIPMTGRVSNVNQLLSSKVIGIKTGTTDEAGGCLLFAVKHITKHADLVFVGVVMGQSSRATAFASASSLIAAADKNFGRRVILPEGSIVGRVSSDWGQNSAVVTASALDSYGWLGKERQPVAQFKISGSFISKGELLGNINFESGEQAEAVKTVAVSEIGAPSLWWRLTNYF